MDSAVNPLNRRLRRPFCLRWQDECDPTATFAHVLVRRNLERSFQRLVMFCASFFIPILYGMYALHQYRPSEFPDSGKGTSS